VGQHLPFVAHKEIQIFFSKRETLSAFLAQFLRTGNSGVLCCVPAHGAGEAVATPELDHAAPAAMKG
jgi:hypothetical protein